MDSWNFGGSVLSYTTWLLLLLLNASDDRLLLQDPEELNDVDEELPAMPEVEDNTARDTLAFMTTSLLNFRLFAALTVYHDEVEYWVRPRSTTWFSKFLLEQYVNKRWLSMFRMTKPAVFALAEVLRPHVQKQDTNYHLSIPVVVRVACTLFKLAHGANFTVCSEMFAIGKSTVSIILRDVVHGINDCLRKEISWPVGEQMQETQRKFCELCSLPAVVGAIDGVQISIAKPARDSADYFYFKTGGYSMNCQAVVDSDKRFLDLYVGMPGSTNDSRMLRRSSLFNKVTHANLLRSAPSVDGFSPYLLADLGYPLLPWIVVPHKESTSLSIAETLFNRKLRKGRSVVENAFGILKQCFRELRGKSDLNVCFLPDVVVCCAILHNILLRQSHDEVEEFLLVLQEEGLEEPQLPRETGTLRQEPVSTADSRADGIAHVGALEKRRELGMYLTARRRGIM